MNPYLKASAIVIAVYAVIVTALWLRRHRLAIADLPAFQRRMLAILLPFCIIGDIVIIVAILALL